MKKSIPILALLVGFSACKNEVEPPKLRYENATKTEIVVQKPDSAQVRVADLPVLMEGTKFLIHPIGDIRVYEKRDKSSYGSSSLESESYHISNFSEFEITGFLSNLNFQELGSSNIVPLTNKPILIQTATYLKSVSDKTKQQLLIYAMADMDTNKDTKVDVNDIKTLYISDISGLNLTKLSPDFQELMDWNLIESKNLLFFRTIEDTNKNGQFDKLDVIHYNVVDLSTKIWKVLQYQPISNVTK